ncbi:MAG: DNA-processing protein DprA [Anaerolineales bacterium]|nr:DNA-processing protein DprA [Anaerolineales bacterium]MCX7608128.1 DNA-processing protein DprA [Anaerolineales bacterium]MDW8226281.1 DNA-processing protein DprA [Anaerolineales bacterium]
MDKRYWVGFNLVKGIGAVRFQALQAYFGSLEAAWKAPIESLVAAGLGPKLAERVVQVRQQVDLDRFFSQIDAQGITVLTWNDEAYPRRLKEIEQPPPVLYLRGTLTSEDTWAVAIVGTRRVTAYGRQVTEELASFLAANGVTVVSGLARGVDAIAHQSALRAGGRTLAVLGSGVDRIYPPEHTQLARQIIEHGALLSDYPPGVPPEAANFPPRNRIISGLSMATVVVEAGETSGALITAQFAADQGREVFAVPGNILAPQSKGTNRLIAEGARPLLSGRDLLDVLNLTRVQEQRQARHVLPTDQLEARLLETLSHEPLHIDEICRQTGLPIERVTATLTMMELKGLARQVGGMNFVAVCETQAEYDTSMTTRPTS